MSRPDPYSLDIGASAALAAQLAEILSTQVNFLKEQRPGDTFRIIVEEESLDGVFIAWGPILALEYTGVKAGRKRLFRFAAGDDDATYYDEKGVSVPRSVIAIPLHYSRMSSPFGWRVHPVLKRKKFHNGTDFSAPSGTPIWACAEGRVTIAGNVGANGNLVAIDHGDGLQSFYAHLSRFAPGIRVGTKVRKKQVIGFVGSTGRSTGPHLHWGIKSKGAFVDPLKYKIQPGTPPPARYRDALRKLINQQNEALNRIAILPPREALAEVDDADDEPMGITDM
jgi:murein DD-endopeptidase MepM/ murein hydrolase activator NlpD